MSEQLPDSGGAYADEVATGSISGLIGRTYRDAKRTVTSGAIGGDMVGVALGTLGGALIAGWFGMR